MRLIQRLLAVAVLLVAPPALFAQQRLAHFAMQLDVASLTRTYCTMQGQFGDPWRDPYPINIAIETAGSSTTITAVTALSAPFARVDIGDRIFIQTADIRESRTVLTNADDDTITVDTAIDLTGGVNTFSYLDLVCGTGSGDGWINVEEFSFLEMTIEYDAGDLTALEVVWECKEGSDVSSPVQVYPGPASDCGFGTLSTNLCQFATAGDALTVPVRYNGFSFCRMGINYSGTDGGTREQVDAIVVGRRYAQP